MLPVLISLGPFKLYSFGVFLVLALLMSLFVLWKRGRELYFEEEELFDSVFFVLLIMLIAARIGYVLMKPEVYGWAVLDWLNIIGKPGLMYEAGLLGGIGAVIYQARKKKWDLFSLSDVLATALSLSLAIMSLGAFLNGSGYGLATNSFFGVTFPGLYEKRLPVQLLGFLLYSVQFWWLWRLEQVYRTLSWYKGNRSEAQTGFIAAVFLITHGLIGLVLAILSEGWLIAGIRGDWLYYLGITLLGGGVLLYRSEMIRSGGSIDRFKQAAEKVSKRKDTKGKRRDKRDSLHRGIFS